MPYFSAARGESSTSPTIEKRPSSSSDLSLPSYHEDTQRQSIEEESIRNSTDVPRRSNVTNEGEATLPPPALASSSSGHGKKKKSARINQGLRVHWARFKKRIGTGDEAPSESLLETALGSTEPTVSSTWERPRQLDQDDGEEEDLGPVDEIVVDKAWWNHSDQHEQTSVTQSEAAYSSPEKSGGSLHFGGSGSGGRDSPIPKPEGFWGLCLPLTLLRWRVWPAILGFFSDSSFDEKAEAHYRKEVWFSSKPLALWSSLFYIVNWVLGCALVPKPFTLGDSIFYFAVAPVLTLPIPFFVIFDFPRDRPLLYHTLVTFSTWCWSVYQVIYIFVCGYYSRIPNSCGTKDFLSLFYYTSALQTIALFGLKLNRFPAMIGAGVFLVMSAAMVIPSRIGWIRNDLNFIIFHGFLLYVHYMKEVAERRMFKLRDQLKSQYKQTQKAQVNERRAAESKRRLTSYVFHEVRVPLNTALIAVQNMEASGTVAKEQEVEFRALEGSLSMMSKVLNDVLDFNRMDSGRFESVARPYPFHSVMRSMFVPLQLATDARGLRFITELDKSIDIIARRVAWESVPGQNSEGFERQLEENPDEDGIVIGDEMRLRQIITNLASNACKFTPAGGTLSIKTKLILPTSHNNSYTHGSYRRTRTMSTCDDPSKEKEKETRERATSRASEDVAHVHANGKAVHHRIEDRYDLEKGEVPELSAKCLDQHNATHQKKHLLDKIVVRIEITDTGYGIKSKDMAKGKLFSAFNQTEQGRQQGGKGTGLGLALVRQIVRLSGGRLGVRSQVGVGSTFWVELPLGVGGKAISSNVSTAAESDGSSTAIGKSQFRPPLQARRMQNLQFSKGSSTGTTGDASETMANSSSRNSYALPQQSTSALKSIMEQGGLVELAPARLVDENQIPTRSIGDPSTGTDASPDTAGDPPSPLDGLPLGSQEPSPPAADSSNNSSSKVSTIRPSFVELPSRPTFTVKGSVNSTPSDLPSPESKNSQASCSPRSDVFDPPLRVLVVDDDPLTRKLMKRMLTRLGCSISTAENGQIALDLILGAGSTPSSETSEGIHSTRTQSIPPSQDSPGLQVFPDPRYELVFLDNQMPVLSGLDLIRKLRDAGRTDFVVGVTGNALLSDQEEYIEAGVDYVITKPVFEVNLKKMLMIAVERRKQGS